MTAHQKLMRAASLVPIVLASIGLIVGVLGLAAGGIILTSPEYADTYTMVHMSEASNPALWSDYSMTAMAGMLVFLGVSVLVYSMLFLAAGIVGFRTAKRLRRLNLCIVLSVTVLFLTVLPAVVYALGGAWSIEAAVTFLIPAFFQSLVIYCAVFLKRSIKNGTVAPLQQEIPESRKPPLGSLALFQVIFAINILATLGVCTFLVSGRYILEPEDIVDFANLVFEGVAFWLILQRSKAARPWIIGFSVFNIVVGTIIAVALGYISPSERLARCWFDVVLLLYFGFAKKPKEVLTAEFSLAFKKELIAKSWDLWKPRTWDFWRSMIIYYCLFSIVGHWMEAGFCTLIKWGLVDGTYDPNSGIWRDYLNPFPIYGVGMVACACALFPLKTKLQEKLGGTWKPLLLSFTVNTLVCAALELVLGFTSNMPDANGVYPLWDYSTMPFNFMGQICLQNTLAFGSVATLMTWVVFPALQRQYVRLPHDMKKALFVALLVFYALVLCLYVIKFVS